jgi:hypothetical protein
MPANEIHPALYVVEWFLAPLAMYLLLFRWRDRLNILHMPWADLTALLVIADVALAIHVAEVPAKFKDLAKYDPVFIAERSHWIVASVACLLLCRAQVKWLEHRIRDIVIRHMSVGWPKFEAAIHFSRTEALAHPKWRKFTWLWSVSVVITALAIALHVVLLGVQLPESYADDFLNQVTFVAQMMLAVLAGSLLLSLAFILTGYCRLLRHVPQNDVASAAD